MRKPPRTVTLGIAFGLTLFGWSAHATTATTERVSVSSEGEESEYGGDSYVTDISDDGRFVAFDSFASNLSPEDSNLFRDAFVHDRETGETERVSLKLDGTESPGGGRDGALSADGRFVALTFVLMKPHWIRDQVIVRDLETDEAERVSVSSDGTNANDDSFGPAISADGRLVAFCSFATNLVGNDTNQDKDVFVHDRETGKVHRMTVSSNEVQGNQGGCDPQISADGRFVSFTSRSTNLVAGDTNGTNDVFVRDRKLGTTFRVNEASDGSQANDGSGEASLSADGRFVVFSSKATNLVKGDTNDVPDVFVRDRKLGTTWRMSKAPDGSQTTHGSRQPSLSADGRFVAFDSASPNLVPADTNKKVDSFVRDRQTGAVERVNVSSTGTQTNRSSLYRNRSQLSADGLYAAFTSGGTNLVPDDTNEADDVFVRGPLW